MPRFFIKTPIKEKVVLLKGEEAHHLLHVYRAEKGMEVLLFDAEGNEYQASVTNCAKKTIELEILSSLGPKWQATIKISLAQALLKSKSWNIVLQKSMELGATRILPVLAKNVDRPAAAGTPERWHKILVAAAKQSGRTSLLMIDEPQKITTLLTEYENNRSDDCLKLLAHNGEKLPSLKSVLQNNRQPEKVLVLVGPEGGFTKSEVDEAEKAGFSLFSLGNTILRAETAALSIVANLNFYYGP